MNCLFCHNPVDKTSICSNCPTRVSYHVTNKIISSVFIYNTHNINSLIFYSVWLDFKKNSAVISKHSKNQGSKFILSLNYLPNINPSNINNKLKTILTFL